MKRFFLKKKYVAEKIPFVLFFLRPQLCDEKANYWLGHAWNWLSRAKKNDPSENKNDFPFNGPIGVKDSSQYPFVSINLFFAQFFREKKGNTPPLREWETQFGTVPCQVVFFFRLQHLVSPWDKSG